MHSHHPALALLIEAAEQLFVEPLLVDSQPADRDRSLLHDKAIDGQFKGGNWNNSTNRRLNSDGRA